MSERNVRGVRECQRSAGMSEEGRKVGTLSRRGEDLASALMLRPHCRNQVSSISESGNTEVRESGGAEARESGEVEKRKAEDVLKVCLS